MRKKPLGYVGSFVVGVVFAAGWTPCIGPILSTILIYASTSKSLVDGDPAFDLLFDRLGNSIFSFLSGL